MGDPIEDAFDPRVCVTCSAPSNIAVVKYWGKRDADLNLPINSSISVTLDQGELCTITTVAASPKFKVDQFWLNGEPDLAIRNDPRFAAVVDGIKRLASDRVDPDTGEVLVRKEEWANLKLHISSKNTFPTAAGLASSAAGFAALTFALAKLMCAEEEFPGQLTTIARQGSGSACRSLMGGIVKWNKGTLSDGTDSLAVPIMPESQWPDLRAIVLITRYGYECENERVFDVRLYCLPTPKIESILRRTNSDPGPDRDPNPSLFLTLVTHDAKYRAKELVEDRLLRMEKACLQRDFKTFAELTMQESNQFHATCADTYPPIFYLNEVSFGIIRAVHTFNSFYNEVKAAYTFDAGPNAVIYVREKDESIMRSYLVSPQLVYWAGGRHSPGDVKKICCAKIGGGPKILEERKLLNVKTGKQATQPSRREK